MKFNLPSISDRKLLFLFAVVLAFMAFPMREWYQNGVIWSDAEGYYMYLPGVFIYDGFEKIPVRAEGQFPHYPGTQKRFTKYTCGVAMMQTPFFLAAHARACAEDKADGYSAYYVYGVLWAALFYAVAGVWLLIKTLRRHFSQTVAWITVMAVFWGSNLYHYTVHEPGMSHVYSFFLVSCLLWLTPKLHEEVIQRKWILLIGLVAGLMVLIRPTNMILLLYPALYGVSSWPDFKARLQFFGQHTGSLWPAALLILAVWIPQMLYWRYTSGNWIMYSYGDEGFIYWNRARMAQVLFDIKNGWLLFSPMMAFSLVGILAGLWLNRYNERWIGLAWLVSWYLFASWWAWWFGGAFGHRSFIDLYPLLAIPFAAVVQAIWRTRSIALIGLFMLVLGALAYYGLGLTSHFISPHYEWNTWRAAIELMLKGKF